MSGTDSEFRLMLRELRTARDLSLAAVAEKVYASRPYVHHVESGRRFPDERFAELADAALSADGRLVAAWRIASAERAQQAAATKALTASLRDSHRLAELDGEDTDTALIFGQVEALAVGYLGIPPLPMLTAALDTRRRVLQRLESGHHHPSERADLYAAVGR